MDANADIVTAATITMIRVEDLFAEENIERLAQKAFEASESHFLTPMAWGDIGHIRQQRWRDIVKATLKAAVETPRAGG